jgi:hypothetical protein
MAVMRILVTGGAGSSDGWPGNAPHFGCDVL